MHQAAGEIEAGHFLNNLPITLDLTDNAGKKTSSLEQTAPGQYEIREVMDPAARKDRRVTSCSGVLFLLFPGCCFFRGAVLFFPGIQFR